MIKPKSLNHDDCIGIISPSYWLSEDDLQRTTSYLKTIGYKLKFGISNSLRWGHSPAIPRKELTIYTVCFLIRILKPLFVPAADMAPIGFCP